MGIDAIKHGNKHITATRKHKHGQAPQTWMESCQVRGFGSPQFLKDQPGSTGLHFPLPLPGLANCQQGQSIGTGSYLVLTGGAQPMWTVIRKSPANNQMNTQMNGFK